MSRILELNKDRERGIGRLKGREKKKYRRR